MRDVWSGLRKKRQLLLYGRGLSDRTMCLQRSDDDRAVLLSNAFEFIKPADIDQNGGRSQPQIEERHQALPARKNLSVVSVLRKSDKTLLKASRLQYRNAGAFICSPRRSKSNL